MGMTSNRRAMLSLDYELFFGASTGSVEHCLIEPIKYLSKVLDRHAIKMVLFVDAGYLSRLRELRSDFKHLATSFDEVRRHLASLARNGHDLQLHIHPHWDSSEFSGDVWRIDTSHYRLHDFAAAEQSEIVRRYKDEVADLGERAVFAYRAGGWCIQPFVDIRDALVGNGITMDSTVYYRGYSDEPGRFYDFRDAPGEAWWRFGDDPCRRDEGGAFVEVPISSVRLTPDFYWRMAVARKFAQPDQKPFGDGASLKPNSRYYLSRLLWGEYSPVSIDGLKSARLAIAFRQAAAEAIFNIMGHPKSLTRDSIDRFGAFLDEFGPGFVTFQDLSGMAHA